MLCIVLYYYLLPADISCLSTERTEKPGTWDLGLGLGLGFLLGVRGWVWGSFWGVVAVVHHLHLHFRSLERWGLY